MGSRLPSGFRRGRVCGGFAAVGEQGGDGLLPGDCFALDFGAGLSGAAARSGSSFARAMCSAMAIWISSVMVPSRS